MTVRNLTEALGQHQDYLRTKAWNAGWSRQPRPPVPDEDIPRCQTAYEAGREAKVQYDRRCAERAAAGKPNEGG